MLGSQLDDMLARLAVAEASVDPGSNPVGVNSPNSIEWVMLGVGAILTAFGAAGVWRSVRGMPEMAEVLPEPAAEGTSPRPTGARGPASGRDFDPNMAGGLPQVSDK